MKFANANSLAPHRMREPMKCKKSWNLRGILIDNEPALF
jgi:hypothetical protein